MKNLLVALAAAFALSGCLQLSARSGAFDKRAASPTTPDNAATDSVCQPLPAPYGNTVEVLPSQAATLPAIVAAAASGTTILLNDGTYNLTGNIILSVPRVTLRSKSGNREAVIIDGGYVSNEPIGIQASDVTVADLTIRRAEYHPIHVQPANSEVMGVLIHNVHIVDPKEQAIKINPNGARTLFTDYGEIRCSKLELTATGRPLVHPYAGGCYTGGIDAHGARGWAIHDNVIEGFWCPNGLAEHGIHMWTGSRDTRIFRNLLKNNARGIGLGMGENWAGRTYSDGPCNGLTQIGHFGGYVANNFIVVTESNIGYDVGIALEQVCSYKVLHNTVASVMAPYSAIEYRFSNTSGVIANNLLTHNLRARDGGTAQTSGNLENAPLTLFVSPATGNFHLLPTAQTAINQGDAAFLEQVSTDYDNQTRDAQPDIGADEYKR